ncbi:MAG: hypothetical protein FRX49_12871 [Trebouxia sp. A1-2]|nr:MAG: hypothetical protein FRX49_12871 [Trebouxia sp. A1-2]
MLNGRALEDEYGQFTFQHAKGCCSTIDYYAASAQCFSAVKEALGLKEAVYKNPHSTAAGKDVAKKKRLQSVTDRVKETWTQKRNVELCELATKDPSQFWKAYKATQSNACLVELSAQFEAFRALMGDEHQLAPQRSGSKSCLYKFTEPNFLSVGSQLPLRTL